ncbi:hypothetical protein BpHYR1_015453 [Brachionus plicatilis]|uniref:Uncharacterized protein n=1 Tax=Brachionus plicatilis TaxID=10195 RepID=A0A3M7P787_BRAPC|nr:hypothetical protein BpHYR1_015453 [Brachionus plicatilis]
MSSYQISIHFKFSSSSLAFQILDFDLVAIWQRKNYQILVRTVLGNVDVIRFNLKFVICIVEDSLHKVFYFTTSLEAWALLAYLLIIL